MKSQRIVTHGGLTINLATIKCFKIKENILIVEHKKRVEFIEHPSLEVQKHEFSESTEMAFNDYETAVVYRDEWENIWQEYIDEQA